MNLNKMWSKTTFIRERKQIWLNLWIKTKQLHHKRITLKKKIHNQRLLWRIKVADPNKKSQTANTKMLATMQRACVIIATTSMAERWRGWQRRASTQTDPTTARACATIATSMASISKRNTTSKRRWWSELSNSFVNKSQSYVSFSYWSHLINLIFKMDYYWSWKTKNDWIQYQKIQWLNINHFYSITYS